MEDEARCSSVVASDRRKISPRGKTFNIPFPSRGPHFILQLVQMINIIRNNALFQRECYNVTLFSALMWLLMKKHFHSLQEAWAFHKQYPGTYIKSAKNQQDQNEKLPSPASL